MVKIVRKFAITLCCAFSIVACANFAVSPGVKGRVTDKEGNPIQATIVMEHTQLGGKTKVATADEHGLFNLSALRMWTPIPFTPVKMSAKITTSAKGYKPVVFTVEGSKTEVKNIQLEAD